MYWRGRKTATVTSTQQTVGVGQNMTISDYVLSKGEGRVGKNQDFLNGSVKDCLGQSYTDCFKTKRRFITKNANVTKFDSFIYCNP